MHVSARIPSSGAGWLVVLLAASCTIEHPNTSALPVRYAIRVARPAEHLFELTMHMRADPGVLRLHLPATTPGDVGLKQHARYLDHFQALRDDTIPLAVERTGAGTWRVPLPETTDLTVRYRVHINERDLLRLGSNGLDTLGGFLEGASVFLYADDHMADPVEVRFDLPPDWRVVTTLAEREPGTYVADGYRALLDAVVQFGSQMRERTITGAGVPVRLVLDRPLPPHDEAAFDRNVAAIVDAESALFPSRPFQEYTIFAHWRPDLDFGGGLEHGQAMVLNIGSKWMLNLPINAAGTIAHELFHAWNGEAFLPRELDRWDFAAANYSPHLWVVEGLTSYFATRTMISAGVLPDSAFFAMISRSLSDYANDAGLDWMSLADAGVAEWAFPPDAPDYYGDGEVVGFFLDLTLRLDTEGERGLEDVMRALYEQSRRSGYRGYDDAQLRAAVDTVAGHDMTPFFDRYVTGRGAVVDTELLARSGLAVDSSRHADGTIEYRLTPREDLTSIQSIIWRHVLHGGDAQAGKSVVGHVSAGADCPEDPRGEPAARLYRMNRCPGDAASRG